MVQIKIDVGRGWKVLPVAMEKLARAFTAPFGLDPFFKGASKYQRTTIGNRFANQTGIEGRPWPGIKSTTPPLRLKNRFSSAPMKDTLALMLGWRDKKTSRVFGSNVLGQEVTRVVTARDDIESGTNTKRLKMSVWSFSSITGKDKRFKAGTRTGAFPYGWYLQNVGVDGKKWPHYFFDTKDVARHVKSLGKEVRFILSRNLSK